eukprot:UN33348
MTVKFFPKDNDLYKFYQSDTLAKEDNKEIKKLTTEFYGKDFRELLNKITGVKCNEKPDSSGSLYLKSHVLLCHDQVEDRSLAYIIYLVDKDWSDKDGGALDLFTSKNGLADKRVRSIIPEWNSVVFFEVSDKSFHQVAEVLTDKKRLTVGGWFHGDKMLKPNPDKDPP